MASTRAPLSSARSPPPSIRDAERRGPSLERYSQWAATPWGQSSGSGRAEPNQEKSAARAFRSDATQARPYRTYDRPETDGSRASRSRGGHVRTCDQKSQTSAALMLAAEDMSPLPLRQILENPKLLVNTWAQLESGKQAPTLSVLAGASDRERWMQNVSRHSAKKRGMPDNFRDHRSEPLESWMSDADLVPWMPHSGRTRMTSVRPVTQSLVVGGNGIREVGHENLRAHFPRAGLAVNVPSDAVARRRRRRKDRRFRRCYSPACPVSGGCWEGASCPAAVFSRAAAAFASSSSFSQLSGGRPLLSIPVKTAYASVLRP